MSQLASVRVMVKLAEITSVPCSTHSLRNALGPLFLVPAVSLELVSFLF